MTSLVNSAEGGTNGTTVSTGNSGGASGNAFDALLTTNATVAYDNAHAHSGALSVKFATAGTAANWAVEWTTSMGTLSQVWFRLYVYFTANPAAGFRIWD